MGIQINGQTDTITAIDGQMTISGADLSTNTLDLSTINATGVSTFAGNIDANGDLDVDGHTELDAVNVSGFLTATSAYYSGDVTVLGTLTYEDVTNVDVVGIATARSGLRITGGGLDVVGVSTFSGDVNILSDSAQLKLGADGDAQIRHNGSNLFIKNSTGQLQYRSLVHIFENQIGDTEYARINSSGNVGIGTDNPQEKLQVQGDVRLVDNSPRIGFHDANASTNIQCTGGIELFDQNGNRGAYMGATEGSNFLSFGISPSAGANPTEKLRITASGNIGIGTDNPASNLHVIGTIRVGESGEYTVDDSRVQHNLRITCPQFTGRGSDGYVDLKGDAGATSFVRILDNGRVGIGTDNPGAILEVAAAANAQRHLRVITHNSGDSCLQSVYPPNGTLRSIALEGSTVDFYTGSGSDTTGTFRGRFNSDGSLGINTTNAAARLDVRGSAFLSPLILTSAGDGSWIKSTYGAISNSVVSSLNNLLIGQNMRGYLNSDGGSANNNYYHTVTYSSGTMGYAGLEFGYGGIAKFFTGTPATTADATFTPTERLRIGPSGQIGLSGENYGTSGQVLTSQGSGSAPQWATVATGTNTDATSLTSTGTVFDFAANTSDIIIITFNFTLSTNTELRLRVGSSSSGTVNTGYKYYCVKDGVNNPSSSSSSDKFILMTSSNTFGTYEFFGNMTLARAGGSGWSQSFRISTPSTNTVTGSGLLTSAGDINRIHLFTSGATLGGYIGATWH